MCEFCGCSGRPVRERPTQQTTNERKPVDERIVAVTPPVSRIDALDRHEDARPAETTAA